MEGCSGADAGGFSGDGKLPCNAIQATRGRIVPIDLALAVSEPHNGVKETLRADAACIGVGRRFWRR